MGYSKKHHSVPCVTSNATKGLTSLSQVSCMHSAERVPTVAADSHRNQQWAAQLACHVSHARSLQKARCRLLALGCAEVASCGALRSVPGIASESSVEVGLAPRSAALQAIQGITAKLCICLASWWQEWMQSESSLMYDHTIHVSINLYDKHARRQGPDQ